MTGILELNLFVCRAGKKHAINRVPMRSFHKELAPFKGPIQDQACLVVPSEQRVVPPDTAAIAH
jgi:hypothetical protein